MIQQEEFDFSVGKTAKPILPPIIGQEEQEEFDFSVGESKQAQPEKTWEEALAPITEHAEKLVTGGLGVKVGGKTLVEHYQERIKQPKSPKDPEEYAKGTLETARQTAQQLWGTVPTSGELMESARTGEIPARYQKPYKSVMEPEEPGLNKLMKLSVAVRDLSKGRGKIAKEIGMTAVEFATWMPDMAAKLITNPKDTLYNDPVGTAMFFSVVSPKIRAKLKGKKNITGKDISEAAEKLPGEVASEMAKVQEGFQVTPKQIAEQKAIHKQVMKDIEGDVPKLGEKPTLPAKTTKPTPPKFTYEDALQTASEGGTLQTKQILKEAISQEPGKILDLQKKIRQREGDTLTLYRVTRGRKTEGIESFTTDINIAKEMGTYNTMRVPVESIVGHSKYQPKYMRRSLAEKEVLVDTTKTAGRPEVKPISPEAQALVTEAEVGGKKVISVSEPTRVRKFTKEELFGDKANIPEKLTKDIDEFHSGFNVFDELKKSLEYAKTGKVPLPGKEQPVKGKPILPPQVAEPKSPTLKKILGEKTGPMAEVPAYQKILDSIKVAEPKRGEQEAIYTKTWGERFTKAESVSKKTFGEAGFEAEKGQLGGKLPRVEWESIRKNIPQKEINGLFEYVKNHPKLTWLESFNARLGLKDLLGGEGTAVPIDSHLILLNKIFPKEFVETLLKNRDKWARIQDTVLDAMGVPRALMASFDLSFGGRQGIFLAARYPKEFGKAWLRQFKQFGSEKAAQANWDAITSNEWYQLSQHRVLGKQKLALTERGALLAQMEEKFMSNLAEKIPLGIGAGVKASGRAYTSFANRLRMDVFATIMRDLEKMGLEPKKNLQLVKETANFVNIGSGRGNLKTFEKSAVILNQLLFSPRLMRSRFTLLNPKYYVKLPKGVRKHAVQSLISFASMGMTFLGVAKLAGADVTLNPLDTDFGKIKIGNTRIDVWGGFQQYLRTGAQVGATAVKQIFKGEQYPNALQRVSRFFQYKEAPVVSLAADFMRGQTSVGDRFRVDEALASRFVPMVVQDVYDLYKDDPESLKTSLSLLGFFGIGLQTYGDESKGKRKGRR